MRLLGLGWLLCLLLLLGANLGNAFFWTSGGAGINGSFCKRDDAALKKIAAWRLQVNSGISIIAVCNVNRESAPVSSNALDTEFFFGGCCEFFLLNPVAAFSELAQKLFGVQQSALYWRFLWSYIFSSCLRWLCFGWWLVLLKILRLLQLLLQLLALRFQRDGHLAAFHRRLDVAATLTHRCRRGLKNLGLYIAQLLTQRFDFTALRLSLRACHSHASPHELAAIISHSSN